MFQPQSTLLRLGKAEDGVSAPLHHTAGRAEETRSVLLKRPWRRQKLLRVASCRDSGGEAHGQRLLSSWSLWAVGCPQKAPCWHPASGCTHVSVLLCSSTKALHLGEPLYSGLVLGSHGARAKTSVTSGEVSGQNPDGQGGSCLP